MTIFIQMSRFFSKNFLTWEKAKSVKRSKAEDEEKGEEREKKAERKRGRETSPSTVLRSVIRRYPFREHENTHLFRDSDLKLDCEA